MPTATTDAITSRRTQGARRPEPEDAPEEAPTVSWTFAPHCGHTPAAASTSFPQTWHTFIFSPNIRFAVAIRTFHHSCEISGSPIKALTRATDSATRAAV